MQKYLENEELVILEGLHAIKHAYRFGAEFVKIYNSDFDEVLDLARELAPDISNFLKSETEKISKEEFRKFFPKNYHGRIVAFAKKNSAPEGLRPSGALVWLEDVKLLSNLGATIRVLAARGVKNMIVSGELAKLIWHKDALRASAGLHFALDNIFSFKNSKDAFNFLKSADYGIFALDADGEELNLAENFSTQSAFVFGSERRGISDFIKARADKILSLPMQDKVSSMNLATSVAATLYRVELN